LLAKAISGEDYFVILPKLIKNIVKVQNEYLEDKKLANALTRGFVPIPSKSALDLKSNY